MTRSLPHDFGSVWGVYDNRDYYVSVLVDNTVYTSRERAEAICDQLNEQEKYGFSVEEHKLEAGP